VQGVLLGLVVDNKLEITNCFPFPRHNDDEDFDEGMSILLVFFSKEMLVNILHLLKNTGKSKALSANWTRTLACSAIDYMCIFKRKSNKKHKLRNI
jgi:translation initiation factor 3 subunit H